MPASAAPVVSCDFSFESAISIRQVCQGRTVDVTLGVENVARGQFILKIFIPGTSLQTLNIKGIEGGTTPKILKRVTPREESDQLEIHFQYSPRKPGGFTCILESPALTMKVAFPLTELGSGSNRPHSGNGAKPPMNPTTAMPAEMTGEFIPDLPALPPDPMPAPAMQPGMTTPPWLGMVEPSLPPDPE